MLYMTSIIKTCWKKQASLLYWLASVLIIFIVGIGLSSKYEGILPAARYPPILAGAINIITFSTIILIATSFSGKRSNSIINSLSKSHGFDDIFWGEIITISIQYGILIIIDFILTLLMQFISFRGIYIGWHMIKIMGITASANIIYTFLVGAASVLFSTIIKSLLNSLVADFALPCFGKIPMGIIMIFIYHHRWLRWNPFDFLFVQTQTITPIDHTMDKLPLISDVAGAILYGMLFLVFAYMAFNKYYRNHQYLRKA